MQIFSNRGLKWKLSIGFILCTAIAALSGLAGIVSLRNIHGSLQATTKQVDENIDGQVSQISNLMPLQAIAVAITNAGSEAELADIRSNLNMLRSAKQSTVETTGELVGLLDGLLALKAKQLKT